MQLTEKLYLCKSQRSQVVVEAHGNNVMSGSEMKGNEMT